MKLVKSNTRLIVVILIIFLLGGFQYVISNNIIHPGSQLLSISPIDTMITTTIPTNILLITTSPRTISTTINWHTKSTSLVTFKYPSNWEEYVVRPHHGYLRFRDKNTNTMKLRIYDSIYRDGSPGESSQAYLDKYQLIDRREIIVDAHKSIYQEVRKPNNIQIQVFIGDVKEKLGNEPEYRGEQIILMDIDDINQLEIGRNIINTILSTFHYTR